MINFFARPANAARWVEQHPREAAADSLVLTAHEALSRAYALFAGVLERDATTNPEAHTEQLNQAGAKEGKR